MIRSLVPIFLVVLMILFCMFEISQWQGRHPKPPTPVTTPQADTPVSGAGGCPDGYAYIPDNPAHCAAPGVGTWHGRSASGASRLYEHWFDDTGRLAGKVYEVDDGEFASMCEPYMGNDETWETQLQAEQYVVEHCGHRDR